MSIKDRQLTARSSAPGVAVEQVPRSSYHFFRCCPKCGGVSSVDGMLPDTGIGGHPLHPQGGNIAILAINPAFALKQWGNGAPDACGGALLGRFEQWVGVAVLVEPAHRDLLFHGQVTLERRLDAAGVDGEGADAEGLADLVKMDRELGIG